MTEPNDLNDNELMAELAAAVAEEEAVSERRRTAARAAFTWRTVDAELAEMLHDSALDAGAAVRSGSDETAHAVLPPGRRDPRGRGGRRDRARRGHRRVRGRRRPPS